MLLISKENKKDIKDHLKIALPLYLYPFRILGYGSFNIGVGVFNLLLPILIYYYINHSNKKNYKILFFVVYLLLLFLITKSNLLSTTNYLFSFIFLYYYLNFVKTCDKALVHFIISSAFFCVLSLAFYFTEVIFNFNDGLYAVVDDSAVFLSLPRLSGIFYEPSHASFIFALLFCSLYVFHKKKYFLKSIITIGFVLTQSLFGYVISILINLQKIILGGLLIIALIYILSINVEQLRDNSGGVRLYGFIYTLQNFSLYDLVIGHGFGYGIKLFSKIIYGYGIEIFNGFFAEQLIDIGLLGIAIILLTIPKIGDHYDFIIFYFILLFNFGFTVSLFPYVLAFISVYKSQLILKNKGKMNTSNPGFP